MESLKTHKNKAIFATSIVVALLIGIAIGSVATLHRRFERGRYMMGGGYSTRGWQQTGGGYGQPQNGYGEQQGGAYDQAPATATGTNPTR